MKAFKGAVEIGEITKRKKIVAVESQDRAGLFWKRDLNTFKMMSKKRLINRFVRYVKVDSISRHEKKFSSIGPKRAVKVSASRPSRIMRAKHIGGDCGNIFGTLKANVRSKTSIMLNAHLDTVVPGNNIKPKVRGGIITSDGTTILGADNKAGVAVIMEVLQTLKNGTFLTATSTLFLPSRKRSVSAGPSSSTGIPKSRHGFCPGRRRR